MNPVVSEDGAGGALVVWFEDVALGPQLRATHVTGAGAIAPGWPSGGLAIAPYVNEYRAIPDGSGGAFVAWNAEQSYVVRLTGTGSVAPGWMANGTPLPLGAGYFSGPALASDGTGGVFVVQPWSDTTSTTHNAHITAFRFTGAGAIAPGWPPEGLTVRDSIDGFVDQPLVAASDITGGAVASWFEKRPTFSGDDRVFAFGFSHDAPVPVQVSLVSAEADPGVARLTWFDAAGSQAAATVYRREPTTEWSAIAVVRPDGTGRITYEDRDVSPAGRYGYRLGVLEGGVEEYLGEAWLDIPGASGIALEGAFPNPGPNLLSVALRLRDSSPAELTVFDPAGRRVASRSVGHLGQGRHVLALGEGADLKPGLYLIVLVQGGTRLTRRAAIVR
jgi:hypothetical protein